MTEGDTVAANNKLVILIVTAAYAMLLMVD